MTEILKMIALNSITKQILFFLLTILFLSSCFLAQNSSNGAYECSWWHLHKHPEYSNYCKEQKEKWGKNKWEN